MPLLIHISFLFSPTVFGAAANNRLKGSILGEAAPPKLSLAYVQLEIIRILRKGKQKGCAAIAIGVAEHLALALLEVADRAVLSVAMIKQSAQVKLEQLK